jgi:7-carboxy-7-deazaguanine synthase
VGAAWDELDAATVADWILESRLPIRLNVQLHKMLWGTGTRR